MTARAKLWTHRPRKNGTCNIKIYTYHEGDKNYAATPHHARPGDWDNDLGRLKPTAPLAKRINAILTRLENEALGGLMGVTNSLLQLVEIYLEECEAGKQPVGESTWKQYRSHLKRLRAFAAYLGKEDISFTEVNMEFYRNFIAYLQDNGCGRAGAGKHIKHLKMFMRIGLDRELHTNTSFKAKGFIAERIRPTDKIYLSREEIKQLESVNLSSRPDLQKERDRFLISYYLVLRFGDSIAIHRSNVLQHGDKSFYRNVAEKTGTISIIPIKPAAMAILKKHDYDLSGDTNQEANRKLKIIASMAGLVANQATPGEPYLAKSALLTTHTARRSAATNMLLDGMPVPEIMQAGGWKREATFKSYILAGGISLAQMSADRAFFQ
ncbi:site-specific integrase [Neolewinella persica]|uniref:site-specific integrase n=1 Tax=Neolewinella persica TaxID=70998 RepID=UPI00037ABACD|nr:site-specific integrase [Neolewinella persica]